MARHIRYIDGKIKKTFYRVSKKKRLRKKELKLYKTVNLDRNEINRHKCAEHYKQMLIRRAAKLISLPTDERNSLMTCWRNKNIKFPMPPPSIEELHQEFIYYTENRKRENGNTRNFTQEFERIENCSTREHTNIKNANIKNSAQKFERIKNYSKTIKKNMQHV